MPLWASRTVFSYNKSPESREQCAASASFAYQHSPIYNLASCRLIEIRSLERERQRQSKLEPAHVYSYMKPLIAIKRHMLIHNATDLQTVSWLEQTESATPARRAHAHAQALTQTHMQAHMHVHNYASECCCHIIVVIFHQSEHRARQNTRPGKSSSGGHPQAKKAPRPEGPPRRQKPSCRA